MAHEEGTHGIAIFRLLQAQLVKAVWGACSRNAACMSSGQASETYMLNRRTSVQPELPFSGHDPVLSLIYPAFHGSSAEIESSDAPGPSFMLLNKYQNDNKYLKEM